MSREIEERINRVAAEQHGLVTSSQLCGLGLSPSGVGRRVAASRLRPVHRGVHMMGAVVSPRAPMMAAILAASTRPGHRRSGTRQCAVISHTSALELLGVRPLRGAGPVHVTVPGSGRASRPGIRFHRVAVLDDDERTVIDGIPVTAPGRTLADVAGMLGTGELERIVAVMQREMLITAAELERLPERYARRRGMAALRTIVQREGGAALTRSELERKCLALLDLGGLPRPHANVPFGPYELDFFWPEERVALEVDGRAHHSSDPRFEGDRARDLWLRSRGIEVIRVTWKQITRAPTRTAVAIGQVLARARAERERR